MWDWVELKYGDGLALVLESGEWGKPYDRLKTKGLSLSPEVERKLTEIPDPAPLLRFSKAVLTRKQGDGNHGGDYPGEARKRASGSLFPLGNRGTVSRGGLKPKAWR